MTGQLTMKGFVQTELLVAFILLTGSLTACLMTMQSSISAALALHDASQGLLLAQTLGKQLSDTGRNGTGEMADFFTQGNNLSANVVSGTHTVNSGPVAPAMQFTVSWQIQPRYIHSGSVTGAAVTADVPWPVLKSGTLTVKWKSHDGIQASSPVTVSSPHPLISADVRKISRLNALTP